MSSVLRGTMHQESIHIVVVVVVVLCCLSEISCCRWFLYLFVNFTSRLRVRSALGEGVASLLAGGERADINQNAGLPVLFPAVAYGITSTVAL